MKFNQLNSTQKKMIQDQLNQTENMKDFLMKLVIIFDLENCKAGSVTKSILSAQMVSAVLPMINPELK